MQPVLSTFLLDHLPTVLAGHGYDVGGSSGGGSGGGAGDEDGGIGTVWIVAAAALALVAVGLLVWLNPPKTTRMRAIAPKALIAAIIAVPLIAWTAFSGGDDPDLIVERWIGVEGTPELLISLGDETLNTLETTNGQRVVRLECVGRDGRLVIDATKKWPFVDEPGYEYPHAHQPATREELLEADRCSVGETDATLEADVEGSLDR
jgi:hypothetical protein